MIKMYKKKIKAKGHKTVVRPGMLFGLERANEEKTGVRTGDCRAEDGEVLFRPYKVE